MKKITTISPSGEYLITEDYVIRLLRIQSIDKKDYIASGLIEPYQIRIRYIGEEEFVILSSKEEEERNIVYKEILRALGSLE